MLILVALLAYDSILMIDDEVELIWRRKLSTASVIFIINRIAVILTAFVKTTENFAAVCSHAQAWIRPSLIVTPACAVSNRGSCR